jgi:hypothetical protein
VDDFSSIDGVAIMEGVNMKTHIMKKILEFSKAADIRYSDLFYKLVKSWADRPVSPLVRT